MTRPDRHRHLDPWTCVIPRCYDNGPVCLADAAWHGLTLSRRGADGIQVWAASACPEHREDLQALMQFVHAMDSACGLPESVFLAEENRCVMPWEDIEKAMAAAEALPTGAAG